MERNFTLSEDINGPLLAAGLAIQMTGALIANTVIFITTLSQSKSLKLPSTVLFTSLIIIHFVMAVFYMPFWLITAATGEWIFGRTAEQKEGTCKFVGFILWYSILVISMTLAAISVDRFLFIVKPQFYKQFMRPKVAMTLVVIIWLVAASLNSTPFFGYGNFVFTSYGSCGPRFEGETVFIVLMLLVFSTVICIIIVTSVWTYCFTRKFIQEHAQLADSSVYVSKKRKLIGIFGVMLIAYVVCFAPGFILAFISQLYDLKSLSYAVALSFFMTATIIIPIIQSYFRPDIKKALIKMYHKIHNHRNTDRSTKPGATVATTA